MNFDPASSFSVIVCTYRRPKFLDECLASLRKQEVEDLEVLVIGVGGDVESEVIARRWGARWTPEEQPRGVSAARSYGIARASTSIVGFVDDDARVGREWVSAILRPFSDPRVGGAGGPVWAAERRPNNRRSPEEPLMVSPFGNDVQGFIPRIAWLRQPPLFPRVIGTNMAFLREAIMRVGGFDPSLVYGYDETDLSVRLCLAGYQIRFVPEATVEHSFAEGPYRNRAVFHNTRSRAYFSFKNFTGKVPFTKLLLGQGLLVSSDFREVRRSRGAYGGIGGFLRGTSEMVTGRARGTLDGIAAARIRQRTTVSGKNDC